MQLRLKWGKQPLLAGQARSQSVYQQAQQAQRGVCRSDQFPPAAQSWEKQLQLIKLARLMRLLQVQQESQLQPRQLLGPSLQMMLQKVVVTAELPWRSTHPFPQPLLRRWYRCRRHQ